MLRYYNFDIVFQEIPDEVTLAINLTCCPNRCEGCHSPHLRQKIGPELTTVELDSIISRYKDSITCVCFMGGDNDVEAIEKLAHYIISTYSLKTAWYSGRNSFPNHTEFFSFIKLGEYQPERGNLKNRLTNQRLYKIEAGEKMDITNLFWK